MRILHHNDMSTCSQKVRFALAEKGLDYESRQLNLRAGDQQHPEYLKLNPNAVVPTLVDGASVLIESTVINEYLDDAYQPGSLKPAQPVNRARMRLWTKQLDEGVHAATSVVSSCIAFRFQHFEIKSKDEVKAQIERIPNAAKREAQMENLFNGVESRFFPDAIRRFDRLLGDMETALADGPYLAGETFSLADIGYAPYAVRLDHLQLAGLWDRRPRFAGWYERIAARPGFRAAIVDLFNPKYLPLMEEKGREAWPRVRGFIGG